MSAYDAPDWGTDEYDGPAAFEFAAEYLAVWCERHGVPQLGPGLLADALSELAQAGFIVSAKLHNHVAGGYADQLQHAHAAADELVRRLGGAA